MNWDQYFLSMAYFIAMKSKDTSTRIGAVIVGPNHEIRSTGYNGLPRGLRDDLPERNERPEKYFWYEHGERNALYNAARMGVPLDGCTLYTQMLPCADCARGIIQSGLVRVVIDTRFEPSAAKWDDHAIRSRAMLETVSVKLDEYAGPLTMDIVGLRGGVTLDEELRR